MAKPSSPVLAGRVLRRLLRQLDFCTNEQLAGAGGGAGSHVQGHGKTERDAAWNFTWLGDGSRGGGVEENRWRQAWSKNCGSAGLMMVGSRGSVRQRCGREFVVCREFASGRAVHPDQGSETDGGASGSGGVGEMKDLLETLKEGVESAGETVVGIGAQAWSLSKEAVDKLSPAISQWLESPYFVDNVLIPSGAAVGTFGFAWIILPTVLRRIHAYAEQAPTARLFGRTSQEVPYDLSLWGALEGPSRLFLSITTLSYLASVVAPTSIAAEHLSQIWSGGAVITGVWFLHNWKRNAIKRLMTNEMLSKVEKERYEALDKLSTVALLLLAGMSLGEASGVAVQSILTVGGIGGVATAFAAKDLLGNILSGSALQFGKPFSVGDSIKAGPVEGKVVEMGMHSTQLLTADKSLMIVPNSFFSSQVIVNSSRVQWRGLVAKFPLQLQNFDKIAKITEEVKVMLQSHPKVYLNEEEPGCFVSNVLGSAFELTVSCNIKPMKKDEYLAVKQEIILASVKIMTGAGAQLGIPP